MLKRIKQAFINLENEELSVSDITVIVSICLVALMLFGQFLGLIMHQI